jgi:hypothetical protein
MVYEAKNKFPAMRGRGSKIMDLYGKKKKKKLIFFKNVCHDILKQ